MKLWGFITIVFLLPLITNAESNRYRYSITSSGLMLKWPANDSSSKSIVTGIEREDRLRTEFSQYYNSFTPQMRKNIDNAFQRDGISRLAQKNTLASGGGKGAVLDVEQRKQLFPEQILAAFQGRFLVVDDKGKLAVRDLKGDKVEVKIDDNDKLSLAKESDKFKKAELAKLDTLLREKMEKARADRSEEDRAQNDAQYTVRAFAEAQKPSGHAK